MRLCPSHVALASLAWTILLGPVVGQEFLPTPPTIVVPRHPWLVADLSQVPEIQYQKLEPLRDPLLTKNVNDLSPQEQDQLQKVRAERSKQIEDELRRINKANETAVDHFMKALLGARADLAGLPWAMGDECRLDHKRSAALVREVLIVRNALRLPKGEASQPHAANKIEKLNWNSYDTLGEKLRSTKLPDGIKTEDLPPARVAALMQILGPASAEVREGMVKRIADVKEADATRALARLAVFSAEVEVRRAALAALKERRKDEYTFILMQGLRYPWPTIARNASDALVALGCKEQVPTLVAFLDEPDPRAPITKGRKTPTVREVVRVNHHRNCVLCHAPVAEGAPISATNVVIAEVPNPAQPLPSQSQGYSKSKKGQNIQLAIRVDFTYLRQDFSMLQPVENAGPWPEMQRFDFLVREREVGAKDVQAYQDWLNQQGAGYVAPNHRAALAALRELTGLDAAPNAQAWRKMLGL